MGDSAQLFLHDFQAFLLLDNPEYSSKWLLVSAVFLRVVISQLVCFVFLVGAGV